MDGDRDTKINDGNYNERIKGDYVENRATSDTFIQKADTVIIKKDSDTNSFFWKLILGGIAVSVVFIVGRTPNPEITHTPEQNHQSQTESSKSNNTNTIILSKEYQEIDLLLANGDWIKADRKTAEIMLKASGQNKDDGLDPKSIEKIPCEVLKDLDRLWLQHSKEHWGFSPQMRIWEKIGGNPNANWETYKIFATNLGWYVPENATFLKYNQLQSFALSAPEGHRPRRWAEAPFAKEGTRRSFFSHTMRCGLDME